MIEDTPPLEHRELAELFRQLASSNDYETAQNLIIKTLANYPDSGIARFEIGTYFDHCAGYEVAAAGANFPEDDPQEVQSLRAQALEYYEQASDMNPQNYKFAYHAAVTARRLQDTKAVNFLRRALKIDPNNTRAWTEAGDLYDMFGETDLALRCYQNVLRFDRRDRMARDKILELGGQPNAFGHVDYTLTDITLKSPAP